MTAESDTARALRYRAKAEELELRASQMSGEDAKKTLSRMATDYLEMAARLDEKSGLSFK